MRRGERQLLAIGILTLFAGEYRRESLIGDVLEQYHERGGWWYWRQVLGVVLAHPYRVFLVCKEIHAPAAEIATNLMSWLLLGLCGIFELVLCASLVLTFTSQNRSNMSLITVSFMIGAAFVCTAAAIRRLRMRRARPT